MKHFKMRFVALAAMILIVAIVTVQGTSMTTIQYKKNKSNTPVVMTINGTEINQDEYTTFMLYNMKYYENQYAMYGISGIWDDPSTAEMLGADLSQATTDMVMYMTLMTQNIKKVPVNVTMNQQIAVQTSINEQIEQIGSEESFWNFIAEFGFSQQAYYNFLYANMCYDAMDTYYFGENGTLRATDEEIIAYLDENYLSAKNILISTIDSTTGEQIRTSEEARAIAEEVMSKLQAGEDFDTLMETYNEDPGMEQYPDGYIFTEGQFVEEFYNMAMSLGDYEYDMVESTYGMHVIQRIPVNFADMLDEYAMGDQYTYRELGSQNLGNMSDLLLEWMDEAEIETTDLYEEINYANVREYASVIETRTVPVEDTITEESTVEATAE